MNLSITPYVGVGPIKLGMTIREVRKAVGLSVRAFKKHSSDLFLSDSFDEAGIYVYYKTPGVCEAVEMATPANPIFNKMSFIERPFNEVAHSLRAHDSDLVVDGDGLTSLKFGFGLYAPSALKSPEDPVEAVIVFERGYYDSLEDED